MNLDVWMQVVRYLLIGAGMYFAKRGVIPDDQVAGTVDTIVNALPAIAAAAGAGWGLWVKFRTKTVPESVGARVTVPTVSPVTGAVQN